LKPVGDDDGRPARGQFFHDIDQPCLSVDIEGACRLIEDDDRSISKECADECNPLPLPS
jgi:hypothetical protein